MQRPGNSCEINQQVVINIYFDHRIERILEIQQIFLKMVDCDCFSVRIHDPIFPYARIFVIIQFSDIIVSRISGRNDFNDKIRRAVAAFPV